MMTSSGRKIIASRISYGIIGPQRALILSTCGMKLGEYCLVGWTKLAIDRVIVLGGISCANQCVVKVIKILFTWIIICVGQVFCLGRGSH